jgi:hypothetical protein
MPNYKMDLKGASCAAPVFLVHLILDVVLYQEVINALLS